MAMALIPIGFATWLAISVCRRYNPAPKYNAETYTGGIYRNCDIGHPAFFDTLVSRSYVFKFVHA